MRLFQLPTSFKASVLLLFVSVATTISAAAQQPAHPFDVGAQYDYTHTNLLPGCDCFSLNGGSLQLQYGISPRLFLLGDVAGAHRGGLTPDGYALTQYTYTAGVRYRPLSGHGRMQPFGELAAGEAHTAGSLSPANSSIGGSSNAFALLTGGGLQIQAGRRWILQPVQADYLLTTFHNGSADRQNDLRLATGFLFRFRR